MSDGAMAPRRTAKLAAREVQPIPLNDLRRQTESLRAEIEMAISAVVDSGRYVLGPNVSAFEKEFAAYCGASHCIAVANGTDALELAIRAVAPASDGEVITVANAGMYAASAIVNVGARPVFADIDPVTMTMSPDALVSGITSQTAAVIVTHLYGQLADMDGLIAIARRHRIPVIEDCAQAHGAQRGGRKAGTFGAIGCFSFYPTKNLGALGDGGALVTNDDKLAEMLRSLRQYGWERKYQAAQPFGRNSRLDELQAAILRIKLPHLDRWNARRREIILRYRASAASTLAIANPIDKDHAGYLCVVRSNRREELRDFLTMRRIATDIHFPVPDHRQRAMRDFVAQETKLAATETATSEILTVPCFPEMTEDEIAHVCNALAEFGRERDAR
jgi:aminotransferase EvaB